MGDLTGNNMYLVYFVLGMIAYTSALTEITKNGCGTTKGCFSVPDKCDSSNNCDYLVTFSRDGDKFVFEMSAKMKWVAVGFNEKKNSMAGTDTTMCVTRSGTVTIHHYDLTERDLPSETTPLPSEISLNESRSDGDKTLCKFFRKVTGSGKLKSLDKSHFLVYAYGDVGGKPIQHSYRSTSPNTVKLDSYINVKAQEVDYSLIKAHGSLLAIAWLGFASIAIFTARYMKLMWGDQKLFGQKVWFLVHRGLMTLAVLFSVIGVILIFVYRNGWSEGIGAHPYTGIITVALAVINPIMALFRPHPGEPKRFIFNWAHRTVGLSALCLAVVTLFLAVFLKQLNIKDAGLPVMIVFCVGIAIVLLFEIILCVMSNGKAEYNTTDDAKGNLEQMQQEQPVLQSRDTWIRYSMFGFVVLVAIATTIALVVIVVTMSLN